MLAHLPNITLYLEEPGKERLYVCHRGNGQFLLNGSSLLVWHWTDILTHYKQDPHTCAREDCLTDILFVATGLFKDRSVSSLLSLGPDNGWLTVGQTEAPYEPYKSLDKLPKSARLFIHREFESCLSVTHVGGGLFEVPGHGPTLYNRHQLLAFYDTMHRGPKESVDPLTTLYIEQGTRQTWRLDQLFAASLADEDWARIGLPEAEAEAEAAAEAVPTTPVRVPSVPEIPSPPQKRRLFGRYEPEPEPEPERHTNPFRKAFHLPPRLSVSYRGRPAILTHQASKTFPDKVLLNLQFLDGSREEVTYFNTTERDDHACEALDFIRMNSSAPVTLRCVLAHSPEWIADQTTDPWPEERTIPALLERLHQKEVALQEELKGLTTVSELQERVLDLEARVKEALCYAPLEDEASLKHRETEAEAQLARVESLTKRSKDLDIRIGQARMLWLSEELADGVDGLAKREAEATEELAELAILEERVAALRALEKRVAEARKVLATV
jgi:hypothetical protein